MLQESRTARWLSSGIVALGLVLRLCLGSHSYSGVFPCPAHFLMHLRLIYGIHVVQGKVILRCMGITRPKDIGWRLLWIWKSKTGGYDAMMRMMCGTADIWNAFVWQVYEYYGEWLGLLGHWLSSIICVSGVCLKETHFQQEDTACSIDCNFCRRVGWVENLCPCSTKDQLCYWILVDTRTHPVNWAWDCLWLLQTC